MIQVLGRRHDPCLRVPANPPKFACHSGQIDFIDSKIGGLKGLPSCPSGFGLRRAPAAGKSLAQNPSLFNVQPLLANEGLGRGDELDLRFTYVRCSDMDAFTNKGINLLRVTSLNGSACAGRRLEDP